MRYTGVTARGIITPIFKQGDDLVKEISNCVIKASEKEGFPLNDGDIIGVTEAVVARTQGNYASCDQISKDIAVKINNASSLGIVFPILSRNRFSILLKAIAKSVDKLYIQLSYPGDEVGNQLVSSDIFDESGVNPYTDSFTLEQFRAFFPKDSTIHTFTGVDYIEFYQSFGDKITILFSNDPTYILRYTENVINCDVHTRKRTKRLLLQAGAKKCFSLDEILSSSLDGSGYNEDFGLLGSNKASEDRVKLFPRDTQSFVKALSERLLQLTGKNIEVLIYGDGCFKDPVGGIWELADPVVSPSFTQRLNGAPNELKMKYFADNQLADLSGDALTNAMKQEIRNKDENLVGCMQSQGTTPRRITDLVGSLCDLVSGSGDRGTPVVLIQGYFTNFATD